MAPELLDRFGSYSGYGKPVDLYYDNTGAIANIKEPRHHKRTKNIERRYHLIRSTVERGDVILLQKITLQIHSQRCCQPKFLNRRVLD